MHYIDTQRQHPKRYDPRDTAITNFWFITKGISRLWDRVREESSAKQLDEFYYKCLGELGYPNQKPLPEYRVGYTQAQRQFVRAMFPFKTFK